MAETLKTKQLALDNYRNWAENATKDLTVIKTNFKDPDNAVMIERALAEHGNMNEWIDDHMISVLAWTINRSIHVSVNGKMLKYHPEGGSDTEPLIGMFLTQWNHYNCNLPKEIIHGLPVDQDEDYVTLKANVDCVDTFCENMCDPVQTNVEISAGSNTVAIADNTKYTDTVAVAEVSTDNVESIKVSQSTKTMSHDDVSRTN